MIEVKVPLALSCTLQGHYTEEWPRKFAGKFSMRSAKCRTCTYLTVQNVGGLLSALDDIRAL